MRICYFLLAALFLSGCSGSPSKSEVRESFLMELKKRCEYAFVNDVKVINSSSPSSGSNQRKVKFSSVVGVKLEGDFLRDYEKHVNSKSLYEKYDSELIGYSKNFEEASKEIANSITAARMRQQKSYGEYGGRTELTEEIENEVRMLNKKKEDIKNSYIADVNAIYQEYATSANGVLISRESAGVEFYERPAMPTIPFGCLGYRDPLTPLGLVYKSVVDRDGNNSEYFTGVKVEIEAERTMIKTDNGWMFTGTL
ncbi:MAG: hypothetical protein Q8N13_15495 [Acidovorax sp.]|nr:hypothetical protein [Acidovorax sp.]